MVKLIGNNQEVGIEKGELVSYVVNGQEYMHQKGSPGWRNTDTEMFPIIGPTNEVGYSVAVPRANAIQDQHGLLRELEYVVLEQTTTQVTYSKVYKAGTLVKNSKYPEKSTQQWLLWPYNFEFQKKVELKDSGLQITFTVAGEKDMAFMLGYHPAFSLQTAAPLIVTGSKTITIPEVLEAGSRAFHVPDCDTISLLDKGEIAIQTEGFGSFMLWTEVSNMVCIEPITFYPSSLPQSKLHEGFQYLNTAPKIFKVHIAIK